MTKDEMKNRISLALKDPILQQGFECICKENAELKEIVNRDNNIIEALKKQIAEMDLYITNAIEIIKGLMRFCRCFAQHHTEDIRYKEAEQFLKKVEE